MFPVNGTFSKNHRAMLTQLTSILKQVTSLCVPGNTLNKIETAARDLLTQAVTSLVPSLSATHINSFAYMPHLIGHHVGMDVHDCASLMPRLGDEPLIPGNVIAIEPALYIPELGYGMRVENTICITETVPCALTQSIVLEPDDVEAMMK